MSDEDVEDIDKLFREGLNSEENWLTLAEKDWQQLKKRLDRNSKKEKRHLAGKTEE